MHLVYLALGTNQGNLTENLKKCLNNFKILKKSTPIKTKPFEMNSKNDFLNQVIQIETELSPQKLLEKLKNIETQMGRTNKNDYSDRIIDIDIISYDDLIFQDDNLIIPHPKMHQRKFVLLPLREIAPNFVHPSSKKTIDEMLEKIDNTL